MIGTRRSKLSVGGILLGVLLGLSLSGCRNARRIAWAGQGRSSLPFELGGFVRQVEPEWLKKQQALTHYLMGLVAEEQGNFQAAERQYREARESDPAGGAIGLRLGAVYLRMNELESAVKTFEAMTRSHPSDARPRFLLGVLYASEGRLEEAASQYTKVLAEDPGNIGALSHLVDLYLLQEKVQEGLSVYERFLKERPDSAVAHFNVGMLYAKAGQWGDAIGHLRRAVLLDPANPEARLALGVSLDLSGQGREAKEEFQKALTLEPANTRLVHYLAQLCYRLGDLEESAAWLTRTLGYTPRDPSLYVELAFLRIEQGNSQEAVRILRLAQELPALPEGQVDLWLGLGLAYQLGGKIAEAEEALRQALSLAPAQVGPRLSLGRFYFRQKRFEEAEVQFRNAFQLDPEDPEILNDLGTLYAEWGVHLGEARQLLQAALDRDPHNPAYMDSLGWAYFKSRQFPEALELLERAAALVPDSEIFEHLGQVYLSLGNPQAAEEVFRKGRALKK
ncbi:MAG: tetratricopeptide repeat protein [Candidatus Omnitrophica bacterium]|nr:tetratricopeptide repeat protein [Candidatus Omnitrophota bacterium]